MSGTAIQTDPSTADFTAVLDLPADRGTVLSFFTSAAGVSRWWGPTEGDASRGGTFVAHFGGNGVNAMRVLEAGPARVAWQPVEVAGTTPTWHTPEWLDTRVEIDLEPAADPAGPHTRLRFRHRGLTPQRECWDECFAGWSYFMASIEALARTGTGTPFQP